MDEIKLSFRDAGKSLEEMSEEISSIVSALEDHASIELKSLLNIAEIAIDNAINQVHEEFLAT